MKFFLIFLLFFSSMLKADEIENTDYTEFFAIKNNVKELLNAVIRENHTVVNKDSQTKITNKLKNGLNNLILDGNDFLFTLMSNLDEVDDTMFFTVLIRHKNIVWEFHIYCGNSNVLFFSRLADSPAKSMEDYYNWLSFEKG